MKVRIIFNRPYILMSILLLLWGSLAAVSKLTMKNGDSFQLQFYMYLFSIIPMTILLIINGKVKILINLSAREILKLILFAFPVYFYYFTYMLALKLIPALEASMINYLFPIMIIVFAVPLNNEKLGFKKIITTLIGFFGVLVILTNGHLMKINLSNLIGDLLALSAAVLWGVFSNLGKRNKIDLFVSNYVYILVSFIFSIISVLLFSRFGTPNLSFLVGSLWIGISNIALAFYIYFKALERTSVNSVANISFLAPFISLLFIWIILKEQITAIQVYGLVIVTIGIALNGLDLYAFYQHKVKKYLIKRYRR